MYKLARLCLQLTFIGSIYCLGIMALMAAPWSLVVIVGLGLKLLANRTKKLWKQGAARWAPRNDLKGMLNTTDGLIIGRLEGKQSRFKDIMGIFDGSQPDKEACKRFMSHKAANEIVRLPNAIHTAAFIPTRGGKGVSLIIPWLMTCEDSCIVLDYKSELAAQAARRRAAMGHEVIILDPYRTLHGKVPYESATLNPLDFAHNEDDARDIAKSVVIREEKEDGNSGHFKDTAEMWIAAMIALTIEHGQEHTRNLQTVQDLLTDPAKMKAAMELLQKSGGMLGRMGNQLNFFVGEERGSTLTTSARFMRFLDSVAIAENTRTSSFNPADLRKGRKTVFICPSIEHSKVLAPWVRMTLGVMLREIMKGGLGEEHKVHVILDEAATLGHMDVVDDLLDKGAGYGLRGQWYFQSVGQLSKCFPNQEQTFLSNVTQIFAGVNDMGLQNGRGTAEYVSKRLGAATVLLESGGTTRTTQSSVSEGRDRSVSHSRSRNDTENWAQHKRELLTPDEVLQLPARTAITFCQGRAPIKSTLLRWYEEKWLIQGWGGRQREKIAVLLGSLFFLLWATLAVYVTHLVAADMHLFERVEFFLKGGRR